MSWKVNSPECLKSMPHSFPEVFLASWLPASLPLCRSNQNSCRKTHPKWGLPLTFPGECLLLNYSAPKEREMGTGTQCLTPGWTSLGNEFYLWQKKNINPRLQFLTDAKWTSVMFSPSSATHLWNTWGWETVQTQILSTMCALCGARQGTRLVNQLSGVALCKLFHVGDTDQW